MFKRFVRPVALLLCCVFLFTGCAQMDWLSAYFGAPSQTTPAGGDTPLAPNETSLSLVYDEYITLAGYSFVEITDVSLVTPSDFEMLDIIDDGSESGSCRLHAIGTGTARLTLATATGGQRTLDLTVTPAPLSLFFLLGEEDARGKAENSWSMESEEGRVYYTYPQLKGGAQLTTGNADSFVPAYLADVEFGKTGSALLVPTNDLTSAGQGRYAGMASALAYKWTEQTDERVWMVNLATAGSTAYDWAPQTGVTLETYSGGAGGCYYKTLAMFASVADTLRSEIDLGHYTLAHMGYFFCQGESNSSDSADAYLAALGSMASGLREELVFRHGDTEKKLDFGGIIASRAGRMSGASGVRMNGVRCAQYYAANSTAERFADLYMLSNATDSWYSNESVAAYFARYDDRSFNNFYGYKKPATLRDLVDINGRYTEFACNELGVTAIENLLVILGLRPGESTPTVRLTGVDGYSEVGAVLRNPYGLAYTAAVPVVSPLYLAKAASPTVTLTPAGQNSVQNYYLTNVAAGSSVEITYRTAGTVPTTESLQAGYALRYDFTSDLPLFSRGSDGKYVFSGYTGQWSCGAVNRETGGYIPYEAIERNLGWLYDGSSIWIGHGGAHAADSWQMGATEKWDAAYAFTAPFEGRVSVDFTSYTAPRYDCLFAIFKNDTMVWPTAGGSRTSSTDYYLVQTTTRLDELRAGVSQLTVDLEEGDVLTFVVRRAVLNETAEVAIWPVVQYG